MTIEARVAASTTIAPAILLLAAAAQAPAAESAAPGPEPPEVVPRPEINWVYRAQEDWLPLADPALRTDPFDSIKYIPIGSDAKTYLSFGLSVRERFESVSFRLPPVFPDDYLLERFQLHADLHLGTHVRIFTQLVDSRASGKTFVGPADQNKLDLEQTFVEVMAPVGPGGLKVTVGRQDPAIDLQRFVAAREGPNVPQPFDSVVADYTVQDWSVVAFYSRPVLPRDGKLFDDRSYPTFTIEGVRIERRNIGAGKLVLFAAYLRDEDGRYLSPVGDERRNVLDLRYGGRAAGWDWDLEGMAQGGHVAEKKIRAWGGGGLFGYTWTSLAWLPRLGLQFDAASGTRNPTGDTAGTFNPLFPNGFYELLAGYPGYANFVHLKSSAMVHPTRRISVLFTAGVLSRQTTADAVYFLPAIPVAGTAGRGSAYSGSYAQVRLDWQISPHLTGAVDAEQFSFSGSLHEAGAHSGHYIGVELRLGI